MVLIFVFSGHLFNTPKLLLYRTLRSHQLVTENFGLDIHWWLGGKTLYAWDLQCPELSNCLCQITPMCLVSDITDVAIDIVSKNVIPHVCHWRMVAEWKCDKKHLGTDHGSTAHLSHSPQRELSKLWVSAQMFLCSTRLVLSISSQRGDRCKLPKSIGNRGKLLEPSLKRPQSGCAAAVGAEQPHVSIRSRRQLQTYKRPDTGGTGHEQHSEGRVRHASLYLILRS